MQREAEYSGRLRKPQPRSDVVLTQAPDHKFDGTTVVGRQQLGAISTCQL
jgi:hypothetical protein